MESFLQTKEWANFKEKKGWKSEWFSDQKNQKILVLEKKLPAGFSFFYAPEVNFPVTKNLINRIKMRAEKEGAIFFRIDFLILQNQKTEKLIELLSSLGFKKSPYSIQPQTRLWIDLGKPIPAILKEMTHKGRYNIKIAQRYKVGVNKKEDIDTFYSLYLSSAKREGFSPRPKEYFIDFVNTLPKKWVKIFIATYQREPIAVGLVLFYKKIASYLYGGFRGFPKEIMAPYLLHWQIILEAKKEGYKIYDFGAISPKNFPKHPWSGLRQFKTRFGGEEINLIGSYDLIFSPFWYKIFNLLDKIRKIR